MLKIQSMPGLRDVQVTVYRGATAEAPSVPGTQVLSPQPVRHFAIDASPLPFDMLSRALRCPCVYVSCIFSHQCCVVGIFKFGLLCSGTWRASWAKSPATLVYSPQPLFRSAGLCSKDHF
jgi:hypothetical protein